MSKSLSFYNMTGGLNTVQDLSTINSTPNRTESPDMMNIEYYKLGGIQTMKGNAQIGQSLVNKVTCGFEYILGNESYMIVTCEDGKVYEYNEETKLFQQIVDGNGNPLQFQSTESQRHSIVSYNNGVVITDSNELIFYNKKVPSLSKRFTPILQTTDAEPITINGYAIASYKGRLFIGSNTSGTLFYSGVGLGTQDVWEEDPETGSDAGGFQGFFEDTSSFTALGTWSEYLVIHREQGTYLLDGTADLSENWVLKPYSEYTTSSQQSYVVANNAYYTYAPEAGGIYPLLSRTLYNSVYQGNELSYKIKDTFDNLDSSKYDEIYATYNPKKKYILFYMPMIDNLDSNGSFNGSGKCYIFDIQTKTWLYRKVPQYVTAAFKFDNNTYIGTKDGLVLQEFKGKSFNNQPIDFYYLTPPFMWGGGTNKTTTKEFRVKMLNSSANHFYVESFKDGTQSSREKRLIKNVNDNLNGLFWDIDYNYPTKNGDNIVALGDWNPDNFNLNAGVYTIKQVESIMYHYLYDGTDYYTPSEINDYSWNVPVYSQPIEDPLYFLGYNQQFVYFRDPEEGEQYNYITYTTGTSYGWAEQNPTDLCYKNGDIYAWVNTNNQSKAVTNLQSKTTTTVSQYAYASWEQVDYGRAGLYKDSYIVRVPAGVNLRAGGNYPCWVLIDGNWVQSKNGGELRVFVYSNAYGLEAPVMIGSGNTWLPLCYIYQDWRNGTGCSERRAGSYDLSTMTTTEQPVGTNPNGLTKNVISSSSNSIVISVNGSNKTLTRYTAGDRGAVDGTPIYTNKLEPETGDIAYSDAKLTTQFGTVAGYSNNQIRVGSIWYKRYTQADTTISVPQYKVKVSMFNSDTLQGTEQSLKPIYNYPELIGLPKSITDTTWDYSDIDEPYITTADLPINPETGERYEKLSDVPFALRGDAWLSQGYQTKRFLLPDQYFETVQFKFSGNIKDGINDEDEDDNMCISGFEVDGIQLAETPWS